MAVILIFCACFWSTCINWSRDIWASCAPTSTPPRDSNIAHSWLLSLAKRMFIMLPAQLPIQPMGSTRLWFIYYIHNAIILALLNSKQHSAVRPSPIEQATDLLSFKMVAKIHLPLQTTSWGQLDGGTSPVSNAVFSFTRRMEDIFVNCIVKSISYNTVCLETCIHPPALACMFVYVHLLRLVCLNWMWISSVNEIQFPLCQQGKR